MSLRDYVSEKLNLHYHSNIFLYLHNHFDIYMLNTIEIVLNYVKSQRIYSFFYSIIVSSKPDGFQKLEFRNRFVGQNSPNKTQLT